MHNLSELITAAATLIGAIMGGFTFYLKNQAFKRDDREKMLRDTEKDREYWHTQYINSQKENEQLKQKIDELERDK